MRSEERVLDTTEGGSRAGKDLPRSPVTQRRVARRPGPAEADPLRFRRRQRRIDNALRWGAPAVWLLTWQLTSMSGLLDRRYWPAPSDIIVAYNDAISSGIIFEATWISLNRILIGFSCGVGVGLVAGMLIGTIRPLRIAFDPIIGALFTIPKLALLPLLLLVFGLGELPKILLVALGVFFIVVISTTAAVSGVNESYLEPARSFGANRLQTLRHVIVPAVLPEVFTALRVAIGTAILLLIGIEFVQGREGLGFLIWNSWQVFLADRMYVGIVTVSLLGVALQTAIAYLGRLLAPWSRLKNS